MRKISYNAWLNVIKTISRILFPMVTFTYAARVFGAEGVGKIDFAKSLVYAFAMLILLGMQNYGIRACSEVKNDKRKLSKIFKELFLVSLFFSLLAYLLLFLLYFSNETISNYFDLIVPYSFTIILSTIGVEWLYFAVEDYKYITIRTIIFQIIALFLMFFLVKSIEDIYIYVFIQVFANSGAYVINFIHSRKYIDYNISEKVEVKRHIKPVFVFCIAVFFSEIFTEMDSVMLGLMSDDYSVGLYSAAYKISQFVSKILGAIIAVTVPRMAFLITNNKIEKGKDLLKKLIHFIILAGLPLVFGIVVYSENIIVLLNGNEFIEGRLASQILAWRGVLTPLNSIFVLNLFLIYNKTRNATIVTGIAAVINILLNYLLIPLFQQNGAAIATITAECIELTIALLLASCIINVRELFFDLWKYIIAMSGMAFVFGVWSINTENDYLNYLGFFVSFCFYFIILFILKTWFVKYIIHNFVFNISKYFKIKNNNS